MKNCFPTYKGIRYGSLDELRKAIQKENSRNQFLEIDASQMRIQLNVEKDIRESDKNLPIQILNLIGILPGNNERYAGVLGGIERIMDKFTEKVLSYQNGPNANSESFIRKIMRKFSSGDNQKIINDAIYNEDISLSTARSKFTSGLISFANNHVKPNMKGNAYAQGTCKIDVVETEDGRIYTGKDAIGKKGTTRELKPMRFIFDGKELEHQEGNTVEMQVRSILSGSNSKFLQIMPAEVVMPYPYLDKFGLTDNMTIEEARAKVSQDGEEKLKEFEDSLNIFFLRIPTSNASAGSVAKIVGFVNDSGNTIIIPHQKNAIDGSDQDIDMLHVFFKSYGRSVRQDELVDDNSEIQNQIFNGISQFYYDPYNFHITFKANDMDFLRDEADLADEEASNVNPERSMTKAHFAASEQRQSEINHDGKAVGYFANMGAFIGKLVSIYNSGDKTIRDSFSNSMTLVRGTAEDISDAIDFVSQLINAATDNAKENILGRLNINERTAGIIASMIMMGYKPNQILKAIRNQDIKDISLKMKQEVDVDSYPSEMQQKLKAVNPYSDVSDEIILKNFNTSSVDLGWNFTANTIEDIDSFVIEQNMIGKIDDSLQGFFINTMYRFSVKGAVITRFGMLTNLTKELPTSPEELHATLYNVETILGMPLKALLNSNTIPSKEQQIEFNVDRLKSSRGYIKGSKVSVYKENESRLRDTNESIDIHLLTKAYPNLMASLKMLDAIVDDTMPSVFYVDMAYKNGLMEYLQSKNGVGLITSKDKLKAIDAAISTYVVGKFISDLPASKRIITLGNQSYDMRIASHRVNFAYTYAIHIAALKDSGIPELENNDFVSAVIVDKTFETGFPIVKLNIPTNAEAGVVVNITNQMKRVSYDNVDSSQFIKATEMYNYLMYGHGARKGSFRNIISNSLDAEISKWQQNLGDDIFANMDELVEAISLITPQNATLTKTRSKGSNEGFTHISIQKSARNKSKRSRSMFALFKNGVQVAPKYSLDVNTFGTSEQTLVPFEDTFTLSMSDMIKYIENGTVKGKTIRPMFYRTKNKNEKVTLTPFLSNGERVFLTIFPNEKGIYSQFVVEKSLSNTVRDTDNESDYTC